jgi:hypothetical protein
MKDRGKFSERGYCNGRDSADFVVTCCVLDRTEIESRWERDFRQPSRPAVGSAHPPVKWIPGIFPGDKAAVTWP